MSKHKPPKKVVVPTKTPTTTTSNVNRPTPTTSTRTASTTARTRQTTIAAPKAELIFGRQNYIWMGIGLGLITLGLILMAGGSMPSPDVWEPERIYSFRRITLAPILIIAGLVVEIYAIFKRNDVIKEDATKKDLV